jgi:hypothetical protein
MSDQDNGQVSTLQRPTTNDPQAWEAYWKAQGWHNQTRVERAATRDLVGDQVKTAKVLKCTFPGSLSTRNGVLRFPSHDKRKTRTPHTGQRWVMEQTTWEVVGGEST